MAKKAIDKLKGWEWDIYKRKACIELAKGLTISEAAKEAGCSSRSISRWKNSEEFQIELDRCSLIYGLASKAERMRQLTKAAKQFVRGDHIDTGNKDHLDYVKAARTEAEGVRLHLVQDIEAILNEDGSNTGSGSDRDKGLPTPEE